MGIPLQHMSTLLFICTVGRGNDRNAMGEPSRPTRSRQMVALDCHVTLLKIVLQFVQV